MFGEQTFAHLRTGFRQTRRVTQTTDWAMQLWSQKNVWRRSVRRHAHLSLLPSVTSALPPSLHLEVIRAPCTAWHFARPADAESCLPVAWSSDVTPTFICVMLASRFADPKVCIFMRKGTLLHQHSLCHH